MLKKVSAQSHEIEMGYIHIIQYTKRTLIHKTTSWSAKRRLTQRCKASTYTTSHNVDLRNVAKCRLTQRRLLNAQYVDFQN